MMLMMLKKNTICFQKKKNGWESGAEDNEGDSDFKEDENIYKDHEAKLIKF